MWEELFPVEQARIIQLVIDGIIVHPDKIIITFHPLGMLSVLHQFMPDLKTHGDIDEPMVMEIPVQFQRKAKRKHIIKPDGCHVIDMQNPNMDEALVKAIGRAHKWQAMLESGEVKSIRQIAEQEKLPNSYAERVIRLTELAPDITSAILEGKQPHSLQLKDLIKGQSFPINWEDQRVALGFSS